ncbi:MAG: hypothetical protein AAF589_02855 [Planctomycetota bacterium]
MDEDDLERLGDEFLAAAGAGEAATPDGGDDGFADDDFADDLGGGSSDELAWRETYFVLFGKDCRPTLTQVEGAIADAGRGLQIENLTADDDGLFLSLLIQAPEDNAALEVSYESGDAVIEQSTELAKMLEKQLEGDQLAQLLRADARLDVMHFERMDDGPAFEGEDLDTMAMEALDPATLITVVEALANLTGGLPIDPAAGELLT